MCVYPLLKIVPNKQHQTCLVNICLKQQCLSDSENDLASCKEKKKTMKETTQF